MEIYFKFINLENTEYMCFADNDTYVKKISFKMDAESSDAVRFYKADSSQDYTYPFTNTSSIVNFNYSQ